MTIYLPEEDRVLPLQAAICWMSIAALLGGRAAEQLVLGDISTGASNDIQRATQMARKMVATYGMSEQLGTVAFDAGHDEVFIGQHHGPGPALLRGGGGGDRRGGPGASSTRPMPAAGKSWSSTATSWTRWPSSCCSMRP